MDFSGVVFLVHEDNWHSLVWWQNNGWVVLNSIPNSIYQLLRGKISRDKYHQNSIQKNQRCDLPSNAQATEGNHKHNVQGVGYLFHACLAIGRVTGMHPASSPGKVLIRVALFWLVTFGCGSWPVVDLIICQSKRSLFISITTHLCI